jgi:hypothetical protein
MQQEVEMMDDQQAKEIQSYTRIFFFSRITFAIALSYVRTLSISETANGYKTFA